MFGFSAFPGKFKTLKGHTFYGRKIDTFHLYETKYADLFKFIEGKPQARTGRNAEKFNSELMSGNDSFKGGSYYDLLKPITNLDSYRNLERRLAAEKVWKNVASRFNQVSVRKRTRSQYDGEYDLDKRWDAEPFTRREIGPRSAKVITVKAEASFSGMVSASTIDEYGAFVTAVVNLLEKNGVMVELYLTYSGKNQAKNDGDIFHSVIKLKNANEYMPLQSMLKAFSCNWYRRAGFAVMVAQAENLNQDVAFGLGQPYEFGKCWESKDGVLSIFSVPSHSQQNDIMSSLLELVGLDNSKPKTEKKKKKHEADDFIETIRKIQASQF